MPNFGSSPQFNEHPALGFVGETIASAAGRPSTPAVGRLVYRSDLKAYEYWNGAAWVGWSGSLTGDAPIVVSVSNGIATISIAAASQSAAGSMSAADKIKLDTATNNNTASKIVQRDASGDFAAHDITANKVTGLAAAVNDTDAVNYAQLKSSQQRISDKGSCRAATTGNITLSGTQTIDGVTLTAGQLVLVKDQTLTKNNGIYVVASGAWTRAANMDDWSEVPGAFVTIEEGTANKESAWLCASDQGGTLGTTDIIWTFFPGAGAIVAGAALSRTGNQLDVVVDNTTIEVNSDSLRIKGGTSGYRLETDTNGLATWVPYKYATTLGNASATSFVINHNLNSSDVICKIYQTASPYSEWITDIEITDPNNVTVRFGTAPTLNQFKIVVMR